jgi:hypothetical protein
MTLQVAMDLSRPVTVVSGCPQSVWMDTEPRFEAALTVVVVGGLENRRAAAVAVARIATLAVEDELLVICGSNRRWPGLIVNLMVAGLRERLPRHDVVALHVTPRVGTHGRELALIEEFLEIGSLPVVVTPTVAVNDVAAEFASRLAADRVLGVSCPTSGTDLHHGWPGLPASPRFPGSAEQLAYLAG